jgi:hypothetical protein
LVWAARPVCRVCSGTAAEKEEVEVEVEVEVVMEEEEEEDVAARKGVGGLEV